MKWLWKPFCYLFYFSCFRYPFKISSMFATRELLHFYLQASSQTLFTMFADFIIGVKYRNRWPTRTHIVFSLWLPIPACGRCYNWLLLGDFHRNQWDPNSSAVPWDILFTMTCCLLCRRYTTEMKQEWETSTWTECIKFTHPCWNKRISWIIFKLFPPLKSSSYMRKRKHC